MKFFYFFSALFVTTSVFSQATVTVDAGNVLKQLSGIENGINLNYLMDGGIESPAQSTTQSLSNLRVKLLRYPGGEKSDNYLFSKAPYTSASPRMALKDTCFWPTNDYRFVDTNSVDKLSWPSALDFDEFIEMSNSVGASPLVVVAYDASFNTRACTGKPTKAQLLTNAVEWVRYANVTRKWNVKYWMIGNESWNNPQYNGRVTPEKYATDLLEFASAMKQVDSSIKIIANGRSDWWKTILESSAVAKIDYLALSEYPTINYTGGYEYFRTNDVDLTEEIDIAISDIDSFAPAPHKSRIKVIASEYNSIDWNGKWSSVNNLGHALVNFQMFGDMVVKPQLEAACMWNTRWVNDANGTLTVYDAFDKNGNPYATGEVIKIWGESLLSDMVSAVSDTGVIKSYASYDEDLKRLNVLMLNKSNATVQVKLAVKNYEADFRGSIWELKGSSVNDVDPDFTMKDSIYDPEDAAVITLAANSVTVVRLQRDELVQPVKLITYQPNPFDGELQIKLKSDFDRLVAVNVFDMIGRRVHHEMRMLRQGNNTMVFDNLSALTPGMYMIKVGDNRNSNTVKVIKR